MVLSTLILVAALAGAVHASPATQGERLDLDACVQRALAAAPDLATARARGVVREEQLRKARAARILPEVGVLSTLAPSRGAEGKLGGTLPSEVVYNTNDIGPWTTVQLGFVQPIWTAGKISAGIEAAAAGVEAQLAATDATAADVAEQAKILYYNVLLARAVRGALDDARDAFQKALTSARERRDKGDADITELDILNLRVGAAEVAKEIPKLEQGEANALDALKRLMGCEPGAAIDLKDTRLEPERGEVPPLEEYERQLFDKNPQWKQVTAGVAAKEQEVRRAEAEYFPQVFLKGGFDYGYAPNRRRQTSPFAYDRFNYLRGPGGELAVGWKLNFHMTAAEVGIKQAELLETEQERRNAQTGLPLELRVAYRRLLETRAQLAELEDGRKAGRAILTFAVSNFDLGIGEPAEILQGLGLYTRVSSNYYEAVRDHNVARATLARIMGEPGTARATAAPPPATDR